MSFWNYRVLKTVINGEDFLAVHSVYYDDNGKIVGYGVTPEPVYGEDIEDLKTQLSLILEATDKKIIDIDNDCREI